MYFRPEGRRGFGRMMMPGMGRHGHHRGPRGGGRMFQHGDLRLLILALIAEAPRHGYEIIREIEARLGGAYTPSPGVVYPTLTMLEETGLVSAEATEGKRRYAMTPEGTAHLAANREAIDAIFARIAEAGSGPEIGPRVLRAMTNLRFALKLRLGRGSVDEATATRIAAILDGAASEIERI